jgi:chorismate dehydratase
MPRILGSVPYLNARPLLAGLARNFEIREAPPAPLAERFRAGEFEAALLPVIDAFRHPDARIVPGCAIGAAGDVLSVRLFLDRPWDDVRTLARDPASHTSNTLLEILLRLHWKRDLPPPPEGALPDGRLVIGDAAMRELGTAREEIDLAGAWTAWTGLPFVFAAWATRAPRPGLGEALREAAAAGLSERDGIADAEALRLGLDAGLCRRYLQHHIRFALGPAEIRGAELFWRYAASLDLAPAAGALRLL